MGWFFLLPLLCLPLGYWLIVMAMHRSPVHDAEVVTETHAPLTLTPIMAGVLYDGRLKPCHLLAAVVDLHLRGGLDVALEGEGTVLMAARPKAARPTDALLKRVLFDGAAKVPTSEARGRLLHARHALTALGEEDLLRRELVRRRDWGAAALFALGLVLTFAVLLFAFARFGFLVGLAAGLPLLVLAQFAYVASTWRLPPTAAGLDALGHLEGYRRHLEEVGRGEAKLDGSPEEHLPFAVAFNVGLPLPHDLDLRLRELADLLP